MAPRVVHARLQSVADPFLRRHLQAVVVAVRPGGQLCYCREAWVPGRTIRKWIEAAVANSLIPVNLGCVGLVHRTGADVLSAQTPGIAELPLDAKTPLHEVGRAQFAIRNGGQV